MKSWILTLILMTLPQVSWALQEHCELNEKEQLVHCYHPLENQLTDSERQELFLRVQNILAQKLADMVLPEPDSVQSVEELNEYTQKKSELLKTFSQLDALASTQQSVEADRWSYMSAVPDAAIILLGGEMGIGIGIGGGAGARIGLVVLPVWRETLNSEGQKNKEGYAVRLSPVFWGHLDGGFTGGAKGVATGALGLVWNLSSQQLVDPKSIVGIGAGPSMGIDAGVGVNLRMGGMENFFHAGFGDFGYFVGEVNMGASAEAHINLSVPILISIESVAKRLQSNPSYRLDMGALQSEINQSLE